MGRERPGHTLQTTALVNEVFVRLIDGKQVQWRSRAHFFAIAAQLMRRILVDAARARRYQKRGGGAQIVSLDEALTVSPDRGREIVALDDALKALAEVDARKSQVVELRYFGGLSVEDTAAALDVSPDTVMRDWRLARGWLLRELSGKPSQGLADFSARDLWGVGKARREHAGHGGGVLDVLRGHPLVGLSLELPPARVVLQRADSAPGDGRIQLHVGAVESIGGVVEGCHGDAACPPSR